MADDDPFADLGDTLSDGPEDESTSESETAPDEADSEDSPPADTTTARDPLTDSAFSYEAAQQRPFYAREATIDDFDAWLRYDLERELNQRGYQNIVVREMTDALLRTVVEEDLVSEVAERFEEAREDPIPESNE